MQKALLGTLFIWFEKGNDNIIPLKKQIIEIPESLRENLLPHMTTQSVKYNSQRDSINSGITPLKGRNLRGRAQQSMALISPDRDPLLSRPRNMSHTPMRINVSAS